MRTARFSGRLSCMHTSCQVHSPHHACPSSPLMSPIIHTPCRPTMNRITDRYKNITFLQLRKKANDCASVMLLQQKMMHHFLLVASTFITHDKRNSPGKNRTIPECSIILVLHKKHRIYQHLNVDVKRNFVIQ